MQKEEEGEEENQLKETEQTSLHEFVYNDLVFANNTKEWDSRINFELNGNLHYLTNILQNLQLSYDERDCNKVSEVSIKFGYYYKKLNEEIKLKRHFKIL